MNESSEASAHEEYGGQPPLTRKPVVFAEGPIHDDAPLVPSGTSSPPSRLVVPGLVAAADVSALVFGMSLAPDAGWGRLLYIGLVLAFFAAGGSYRARTHRSLLQEARSVVVPILAPVAVLAIVSQGSSVVGSIAPVVLVTAGLVLLCRAVIYSVIRALRRRGQLMEPTLIVGGGQVAARLAETLSTHPECGMAPLGFVDRLDSEGLPLPVLADVDGLDRVLREFQVRRVLIAFSTHRESEMVDILRSCREARVDVRVVPRFFELGAAPRCSSTEDLWGIKLIRVRPSDLRSVGYAIPRADAVESRRPPLRVVAHPSEGEDRGVAATVHGSTVSLVIPAKNEAKNIGWVLDRVPHFVSEVILVDGDSKDDTVEVAKSRCPDIRVVHQERPGKGAALRAGFAAARGDFIVMIDADGSMDPNELARYLDPLEHGYQFVKGSRYMAGGSSEDLTLLRRAGNSGLMLCVNTLFASRFSDLCYGFSAFRRDCLEALALQSDGFEIETEMCLRAVKADLRIAEVPSVELCRLHGESNLRTFRDGQRVLRKLLRERVTRLPRELTSDALPALAVIDTVQP